MVVFGKHTLSGVWLSDMVIYWNHGKGIDYTPTNLATVYVVIQGMG